MSACITMYDGNLAIYNLFNCLLQIISTINTRRTIISNNSLQAHQVFNMDEAGWSQKEGATHTKGIILSSMKTGVVEHHAKRDHVTTTIMVSADGQVCPPMITTTMELTEDCIDQIFPLCKA